jgi:hypothetical protein
MTTARKIGMVALLCVIGAAVLIFATANVHEDGLVKFRVRGAVFDKATTAPLGDVEVLLLLDESAAHDKERLEELYRLYSPMWDESLDPSEWIGRSRDDGKYVAEGSRRYSRRYMSIFGLGRPRTQPFGEAWLAYRKKGYKTKVIEVKTAGWKNAYIGEDMFNPVDNVYLENSGPADLLSLNYED